MTKKKQQQKKQQTNKLIYKVKSDLYTGWPKRNYQLKN